MVYINLKRMVEGFLAGMLITLFALMVVDAVIRPERLSCGPVCAEDNIAEITRQIDASTIGGILEGGSYLCMDTGESILGQELANASSASSVVFGCEGACEGLNASKTNITAKKDVIFKTNVECIQSGSKKCTININQDGY